MAEYIEREALYEKAYWHGEHPDVGNPFPDGVDAIDIKDVDAIPSADVAPVRHGRWICKRKGYEEYECSVCHGMDSNCSDYYADHVVTEQEYCPFCGAMMDGGSD